MHDSIQSLLGAIVKKHTDKLSLSCWELYYHLSDLLSAIVRLFEIEDFAHHW